MAYRESPPTQLACPRCTNPLPPLDVARCTCGLWLSAWAATEILSPDERRADRATRWWKVRAPCPICGETMLLRGDGEGHFLGCDGHGFWVDADAIAHTSVARGIDHEAIALKRADQDRMDAERVATEQATEERMAEKRAKDERESLLAQKIGPVARPPKPREPPPPTAEELAAQRAREVYDRVANMFTREVADYLFDRMADLERRNTELERRLARLESRL